MSPRRRVPQQRVDQARALAIVAEMNIVAQEGPGPGRARVIQEGLRLLAWGYDHSAEMVATMSAAREAMGMYQDPRRKHKVPAHVAAESARVALARLQELVIERWPDIEAPRVTRRDSTVSDSRRDKRRFALPHTEDTPRPAD